MKFQIKGKMKTKEIENLTLIEPKKLQKIEIILSNGKKKEHIGIVIKKEDVAGDVLISLNKFIKSIKEINGYIG